VLDLFYMPETKHPVKAKLLLSSNLANIFGFGLFLPLYGGYILALKQHPEVGSFLWSAHTLAIGIFALVFGRLEDNKSNWFARFLISGNFLQLIGISIILVTSHIGWFGVGLIFYSLGVGILSPAWLAMFSKSLDGKHTARGWSYAQGGGALAGAGGAAMGGLLFSAYGYIGVFAMALVLHAVGTILAMMAVQQKSVYSLIDHRNKTDTVIK